MAEGRRHDSSATTTSHRRGVRIAGVGSCVPDRVVTNADLEKIFDTSDEWIRQRTGIRERRLVEPDGGQTVRTLAREALRRALDMAGMAPTELEMIILGSVSAETRVPGVSCRIAADLGAVGAGAFDLIAGCSGFVYSLNIGHDLVRSGAYNAVGVIGCDVMSEIMDVTDRSTAILFGDAAGAAVLRATDDPTKGLIAQSMHSDGARWKDLYIAHSERDLPEGQTFETVKPDVLQMNGREIYKFAVKTFGDLIHETLEKAGVQASDVAQFICHQSNARILESARERFGIPHEKLYVNIDRFGNSSAGSVPLCLDQLWRAGRIHEGDIVLLVAFGAGLTWASSLWRI